MEHDTASSIKTASSMTNNAANADMATKKHEKTARGADASGAAPFPTDAAKADKPYRSGWRDYFEYPFRIFFLCISATTPVVALFWTFSMMGASFYEPMTTHALGFLNVVGGAAFSGFLFTAVPEWTHWTKNLFPQGVAAFVVWLAGTLLLIPAPFWSAWVFLVLWCHLLIWASVVCVAKRDDRHLSLILALALIMSLQAGYAATGSFEVLRALLHAFMIGVSIVVFRVGKAMGQEALDRLGLEDSFFAPNPFHRNITVLALWALAFAEIFLDPVAAGWLSVGAGLTFLGRLRDFHHSRLLGAYYVRWIYLVMVFAGAGYVWRGVCLVGGVGNPIYGFHLSAIGGFLLMVLEVMLIAGRIHSSLELLFLPRMRVALGLVSLAALARTVGPALGWDYLVFSIYVPGVLVATAFLTYFAPFWRVFRDSPALPVD